MSSSNPPANINIIYAYLNISQKTFYYSVFIASRALSFMALRAG